MTHRAFFSASRNFAPLITDPRFTPDQVNVRQQRSNPSSLYQQVRRMLALRKKHPAFSRGDFTWVDCGHPSLAVFNRHGAAERLLAVHNLSVQTVTAKLPPEFGAERKDLWTGEKTKGSEIVLPGLGYRWLSYSL
jgi:maltose alpha-D-glucosyltransferase/alpha-amylase